MRNPDVSEEALMIGSKYHMDEIEEVFGSGGFMAGINPRKDDHEDLEYIVLTSSGQSHYADHMRGDRIRYIGQDRGEGDQPKSGRNGRLIDQADQLTVPIYLFSRESKGKDWEYQGLVDVVGHEYVSDGKRMINRFLLERIGISSSLEYTGAAADLDGGAEDIPLEEDDREAVETGERKARSSIFRRRVKEHYSGQCAICGSDRRTPEGTPEVEAAHIYPRRENGRDHYRNGMALCKLHHWAFDCGWISVSDNYEILVKNKQHRSEAKEFGQLEGNKIQLPDNEENRPLPKFLKKHRDLHNFDPT